MQLKYRGRKVLIGSLLLLLTACVYSVAVPVGTLWTGKDSHLFNLSLGLMSGLVVLIFQFLVDNQRDFQLEELQTTHIVRVLDSRDKEDYYRDIIRQASKEIVIFGVTASRFLADFADEQHPSDDKKVLISALNKRVKVRFLVAARAKLSESNHANFDKARIHLNELRAKFPLLFEVRYYEHEPTLSMVVADKNFLVGPVFTNKESKHTVTIHAMDGGAFAKDYWENFEKEWQMLSPPKT
ncbi:MAG: hypothetical protein H7249_18015 [Chitinophagaceae bacterium]|nr:hypothetical protein [Oligoflexus sp.]